MSDANPIVAARALQPLIGEKRRDGELRARLVPEVVAAAGKAGLFRLFAPREVGGLEVTPSQAFLATAEIAAADPAVSWYMVNSIPAWGWRIFASATAQAARRSAATSTWTASIVQFRWNTTPSATNTALSSSARSRSSLARI